ncbi:hypothetical protein A7W90_00675 [Clostridium sp. Bc-iso-3]|nr:hypothetical protein A7W90_00675 [Clostridium sp. Bc-iso-3]
MKILYFVDRLRHGGIQTFLYNYISNMDLSKNEISLLLLDDGKTYSLEEEFMKLGVKLYKLSNIWINKPFDYIKYKNAIDSFFAQHNDFDIVHLHSSSKNYYILKCAEKYNIPVRIAHSHNTGFQTNNPMKVFIGNRMKSRLKKYANYYFACSDLAAKWLFESTDNVRIIRNAVDLSKFRFNPEKRAAIRKKLSISDNLAICNIGRLEKQKNHDFLLEIFAEVVKLNSNAKLYLIGEGSLKKELMKKVDILAISDNTHFLGYRSDVADLLQAMDIILMPSLYEGFPITAVEAQAEGVPCIFSNTITAEANLLPETCYLSLKDSPKEWAKTVIDIYSTYCRDDKKDELTKAGFNLQEETSKLIKFYEQAVEGERKLL